MIVNKEVKRFIVLSAVFSSLVVAGFSYLPFLGKMSPANLMNAGAFLNNINTDSVKVYTLPANDSLVNPAVAVPVLDFFTDKIIHYKYDSRSYPSFESIKESSVRFTWEFTDPAYYASGGNAMRDEPVVIISNSPDDKIPESIGKEIAGYRLTGKFMSSAGVFQYNPMVMVYQLKEGRSSP